MSELRDKINDVVLFALGDAYDGASMSNDDDVYHYTDQIMVLVEAALAEQREAIADALIEAQKLHPDNAYWCQDLDQAARIVRDFGKEATS